MALPVPLLRYGSETLLWKEEERSRIRVLLTDNLSLYGIRRMDSPAARIRELCGVTKGLMVFSSGSTM